MWILLLVGLISSVCGTLAVPHSPTRYEVEEDEEINISWDIQTKAGIFLTSITCFFLSKPVKVLYRMINGAEVPESQDQQFSGRVQFDRNSLREGRVKLYVSNVSVEDSGEYSCDLGVKSDETLRTWELLTSEMFVVNVSRTPERDNGHVPPTTSEGLKHPRRNVYKEYAFLAVFIGLQFATVAAALKLFLCQKDSDQDGCPGRERLPSQQRNVVIVHSPDCLTAVG